jgi:hypothetical protein
MTDKLKSKLAGNCLLGMGNRLMGVYFEFWKGPQAWQLGFRALVSVDMMTMASSVHQSLAKVIFCLAFWTIFYLPGSPFRRMHGDIRISDQTPHRLNPATKMSR